jgi:hypothetical protein
MIHDRRPEMQDYNAALVMTLCITNCVATYC